MDHIRQADCGLVDVATAYHGAVLRFLNVTTI
jgi:hypothetical protein